MASRPEIVQRSRDELFPRSRLATHKRNTDVRREATNQRERLLHDGAASDHPAQLEIMRNRAFHRRKAATPLHLVADRRQDLLKPRQLERFSNVVTGTELDRLD